MLGCLCCVGALILRSPASLCVFCGFTTSTSPGTASTHVCPLASGNPIQTDAFLQVLTSRVNDSFHQRLSKSRRRRRPSRSRRKGAMLLSGLSAR